MPFCPSVRKQRLSKDFVQFTEALYGQIMISSLFWDVTQRRLLVTDVSVQCIGSIFSGQAVLDVLHGLLDCVSSHKSEDTVDTRGDSLN
jgi:hypothetical protein